MLAALFSYPHLYEDSYCKEVKNWIMFTLSAAYSIEPGISKTDKGYP